MLQKVLYKLLKPFNRKINSLIEHGDWSIVKSSFKSIGENSYIPFPMYIYNAKYISIGKNFNSLYNLRIEAIDNYYDQSFTPEIKIGNNVRFNSDCHVGAISKVSIGDGVLIASKVFISDHSHGITEIEDLKVQPELRKLTSKGPVVIENNVWIGEGACILSGVTVGESSIIASNSVVNKSVPPFSVVGGIPAKIIKKLI